MTIFSPLEIVGDIARMTQAERVGVPVVVLAFSGHNVAAKPTVARTAKVLCVVLPIGVLALCDQLRPFFLCRGWLILPPLRDGSRSKKLLDGRVSNVGRFGGGHLLVIG